MFSFENATPSVRRETGFGVKVTTGDRPATPETGVTVLVKTAGPENRLKPLMLTFAKLDFPGTMSALLGVTPTPSLGPSPSFLQAVSGCNSHPE